MNKKMILTTIALAIALFIGFGLLKAKELTSLQIVKVITIKGARSDVFNMVSHLKNYPKWSPFLVQDPTQQYEVKGVDGTIGSQFHWSGNGGKDLGFQEVVKLDSLNFVGIKCDIQKPFVAYPTFDYTFTDTAEGVQVTQDFKLESGLVDAFFMWLFGAKGEMEKTNAQGLDLLKKAIEN